MNLFYRLISSLLLAITVPLMAGCTPLAIAGTVAEAVDSQTPASDPVFSTLADEKAYYALLKFEVEANEMASLAVDMGVLTPGSEKAVLVADLLQRLTGVVEMAEQAKALNDVVLLASKIREGRSLYTHIVGRLF